VRRLSVFAIVVVLLAGCTGEVSDQGPKTPSPSPAEPSPTESEPESASPSASPSPVAAATPSPEPTDGPAPGDQLVAEQNGLGLVSFGAAPDDVIAAVSIRLGEPDEDSDWQPLGSIYGVCPGTRTRVVRWGDLTTVFSDGPTDYGPEGQEHFFTYRIASNDPAGAAGQSPLTSDGIGIGSTRAQLEEAYGVDTLDITPANELGGPYWSLYAEGPSLRGTLTDDTPEALVDTVEAGIGCGE
jgi:hypothetical protein